MTEWRLLQQKDKVTFLYYYGSKVGLTNETLGMQNEVYFVLTLIRIWVLFNKVARNIGVSIGYWNSYPGKPRSYTNNKWNHQIKKMRKNGKLIGMTEESRIK